MIKRYAVENTEPTYLRIWQTITFGKEILPLDFFKHNTLFTDEHIIKLSVYQFDSNTRFFYLSGNILSVTSDEPIYNYLDTGRIINYKGGNRYNYCITIYIFNDLLIDDKKILEFEDYSLKNNLNLKILTETEKEEVYLIFNEDLEKITGALIENRKQTELEDKISEEEATKNDLEIKKRENLIEQYKKMTLLEDDNTIVKDNYFVDKDKGLKIEFKGKIVDIFSKDELITTYNRYQNQFIVLGYRNFITVLNRVYKQGKYEDKMEQKLINLNKKLLNFKIYSYNQETKTEVFLKEIKIENNINDKGKLRFKVNGVKMPIQKMGNIFDFLCFGRYGSSLDTNTIIERLTNLEKYLEQIRLYSGMQLDLLRGKTIEIHINQVTIPIHFNIMAEDKDHWKISIDNFSIDKDYTAVKDAFRYLSGGGLSAISRICDDLNAGKELEDILIGKVRDYTVKRQLAEERAEKLFADFLEKNKTKVFKKDGGYICKGKLKNYIVKMKDEENCGVWSYPENNYICINEKTKSGQYLCKYDKLLQFCLTMINDGNLREEIHTIR